MTARVTDADREVALELLCLASVADYPEAIAQALADERARTVAACVALIRDYAEGLPDSPPKGPGRMWMHEFADELGAMMGGGDE